MHTNVTIPRLLVLPLVLACFVSHVDIRTYLAYA